MYIKEIKSVALKLPGVKSVSHIRPRAYCIAKPAACCAVFVTPPMDAEPHLRQTQNSTCEIVHKNVSHVKAGEWYVLAYVVIPNYSGEIRVIDMPNSYWVEVSRSILFHGFVFISSKSFWP
jgi:hypothetical protein